MTSLRTRMMVALMALTLLVGAIVVGVAVGGSNGTETAESAGAALPVDGESEAFTAAAGASPEAPATATFAKSKKSAKAGKNRPADLTLRYENNGFGATVGTAVSAKAAATISPSSVIDGGLIFVSASPNELGTNTTITLTGAGGTAVFDIHTSCSKPLVVGMTFSANGAVLVLVSTFDVAGLPACGNPVIPNPAQLTIVKSTDPSGTGAVFTFQPSPNIAGGNFTLLHGGSKTFVLDPDTYVVTEINLPANWRLDGVTCDTTSFQVNGTTLQVTLAAGDDVTCTFSNVRDDAQLTIEKETDPSSTGAVFTFQPSFSSTFTLLDGGSKTFDLAPGTYTVTEFNLPAGWDLDGVTCDTTTFQVNGPTLQVTLAAGDDVTCTFSNERDEAQLTIVKETDPSGTGAVFTFQPSFDNTFTLRDGDSKTFDLAPGTYVVSEISLPAGWTSDGVTCDNGTSFPSVVASVTLAAGDNVTCTFFNERDDAQLTIVKRTDPSGTGAVFTFQPSFSGTFTLRDGDSKTFVLAPGAYQVSEINLPVDWTSDGVECDNGTSFPSVVASVTLAAGDNVTCTFFNERDDAPPARLRIVKETDPDVTGAVFGFQSTELGTFALRDNEAIQFEGLDPDRTYVITEILTGDWDLDQVDCDTNEFSVQGNTLRVTLRAGDDVTCTFFNEREPEPNLRIRLEKATNGRDADTPTGPILRAGDAVRWTYVVTNTGNATLRDVTIIDDNGTATPADDIVVATGLTLAPGQSRTVTMTGTAKIGQFRNDAGVFSNCGGAIAQAGQVGRCVGPRDSDPSHYLVRQLPPPRPGIRLEKATNGQDADTPTGPVLRAGDPVTWTFVVTNTGDVTLHDVAIVDDNGTANPADDIVVASGLTLAPGQSITAVLTGFAEIGQFRNDALALSGCGGPLAQASDAARCDGPSDRDPSHYLVRVPVTPPNGLPNGGSGGVADFFQPGVSLWATLSLLAAGLLFIGGARFQGLGRRMR